jgi:hypothetical protein
MTVFADQKLFMDICGQKPSLEMADLYRKLVTEEYSEFMEAWYGLVSEDVLTGDDFKDYPERVSEVIDACMDIIYVTIGMTHALGLNPQPFWDEVQRSNMSKFTKHECQVCDGIGSVSETTDIGLAEKECPECNGRGYFYTVTRREDGKILKPESFSKPNLLSIVKSEYRL